MKSILSTASAQNLLATACLKERFTDEQIVDRIVALKTGATEDAVARAKALVQAEESK